MTAWHKVCVAFPRKRPPVVGGKGGAAARGEHEAVPQGVEAMHPDRFEAWSRGLATSSSRRTILGLLGLGVAGTATVAGLDAALAKNNNRDRKRRSRKQNGGARVVEFDNLIGIPLRAHEPGKNFKGTLSVLRFEEQNGAIVAIASLTGKVTGKGNGNRRINRELTIPVSFGADGGEASAASVRAAATCEILNLVLGPIDLNLLGLRLQVNEIRIRLTADQFGGLLGALLCAIANLLNGGGLLSQIVEALNDLLDLLRTV
jgi:hypothetical protein